MDGTSIKGFACVGMPSSTGSMRIDMIFYASSHQNIKQCSQFNWEYSKLIRVEQKWPMKEHPCSETGAKETSPTPNQLRN